MVGGQRLITVLPAYNAERTLEKTVHEVPPGLVDEFVLVDTVLQTETHPLDHNSDDFFFENQVLAHGYRLGAVGGKS